MSQNTKNDLGKGLGLILGQEKCLLNCTPGSWKASEASVKAAGLRTGPRSRMVDETGKVVVDILIVDVGCGGGVIHK